MRETELLEEVSLLGLKAVKCDWNGEGKDGIAVLLLARWKYYNYVYNKAPRPSESKYSYQQICPYLMYWYCDTNTIAPKTALFGSDNSQYFDGWGIQAGALRVHGTPNQFIFGDKTTNKEGVFITKT